MNATSDIWWRQITGARKFLQKTADTLTDGKSVLIRLPEKTPWLDDMRDILTEFLNKKFGGLTTVYPIDASDVAKPANFVFENFCSEDVKAQLVPIDENAHVKFLAARDDISLNDTCLWIRNTSDAQAAEWFDFIADYRKFGGRGIFLLETNADFDFVDKAGVESFSFDDEVSDYDCFAFNILLATQFTTGDRKIKRYLAELAANMTGVDVEQGARCIRFGNEFLKNPAAVLPDKSHEEIHHALWLTQLKLIFPLLEIFRRDFVKKYEPQIESLLPYVASNRKLIDKPDDAELGDLYSMLASENCLSCDDWERLKIYREARNRLAHLETLTLAQVETILHS